MTDSTSYFQTHSAAIEAALSSCIALVSRVQPADPLTFIGAHLTQMHQGTRPAGGASIEFDADANTLRALGLAVAAHMEDYQDTTPRHPTPAAAHAAQLAVERAASANPIDPKAARSESAGGEEPPEEQRWSVQKWLDGLPLAPPIAHALLRPLEMIVGGEPSAAEQLEYMKALSVLDVRTMTEFLRASTLLDNLAQALVTSVSDLAGGDTLTVSALQSKFVDDAAFTLAFGARHQPIPLCPYPMPPTPCVPPHAFHPMRSSHPPP